MGADTRTLKYYNESYSEQYATHCLYFAHGAYCPQSSLNSWTCKWCKYIPNFQITNVTQIDYLQAFVGFDVEYNQILVSFRGSQNAVDWLDDFDVLQTAYPNVSNAWVHKGFYDAWKKELFPSVMSATKYLMEQHNGKPILITGHSLGAAIAQIAAMDIANYANSVDNDALIYLYDYGSPRWGNLALIEHFEGLIGYHYRVVNKHDIVPTVPAEDLGLHSKYHHSGTEVWYTNDSPLQYTECDGSGEDKKCNYFGYSAEDHLHYLNIYE